eukprot:CAMPEP_0201143318 /NCGR_PEP_ID=MMETSP0851-20130426/5080_1 /ASSEMBLY_ACC=CAM_ASM_000631 /TAXON_ID=183588 /ORGANISM="Pseudo-nitzschia fraudulenta, Strain WWA7" /LENGTH=318 /DNA_ID=CAMNT_0047417515 /DNA_START=132 /DNA_END=1088 /DNA_ORIENTATION=+
MKSYSQPAVPSLYFETHHKDAASANSGNNYDNSSPSSELPSEILSQCLTSYANWGDLAKLACVQKSWSNIVVDTATQSSLSQWELAVALLEGDCGLEKSPERAVRILKTLSHVTIDESTGQPIGDKTDDEEESSSSNNNNNNNHCTMAMKKIARCYLEGTGVSQDSGVAVAWMDAAFTIGNDADAAHDLAVIYEYGRHGVEIDVVAAAEWFERAAQKGNIESMVELGLCYELGCGVEQSDEQALDWYTRAANLGHATAKFSVGEIFEEARGVPQSDEEACLWYYRAALTGCDDSKLALRRLYDIARIVVPGVSSILNA